MYSKYSIFFLLTGFIFGLSGCGEDLIQPDCVEGKIVGNTCDGGILIQVYSNEKIGVPLTYMGENGPEDYDNVVSTFSPFNAVSLRGQKVYFQYRLASPDEQHHGICNSMVLMYSAPQVILSNVGLVGCGREGEWK